MLYLLFFWEWNVLDENDLYNRGYEGGLKGIRLTDICFEIENQVFHGEQLDLYEKMAVRTKISEGYDRAIIELQNRKSESEFFEKRRNSSESSCDSAHLRTPSSDEVIGCAIICFAVLLMWIFFGLP